MPQFASLIYDVRGDAVPDPSAKEPERKLTLARACELALDTPLREDQDEALSKKLARGKLVEQIFEAGASANMKVLDLTAEEIALLKERVGKVFTVASVVRAICKQLDAATD